jgi:cellulase
MDIWEANSVATVYTPHTCSGVGSFLCSGPEECGRAGVCDKPGCGINPYREGAQRFYGPGLRVDTTRPFTVVTQFVSSDSTATGILSEIRRLYIQDGELIQNADVTLQATAEGAISEEYCTARNASDFLRLGGVRGMGESLKRGMVLIFSIWNSDGDFMRWLDSGNSGPCSPTAGDPKLIVDQNPEVSVTFSNIRWGEIGSTFNLSAQLALPGVVAAAALSGSSPKNSVLSSGMVVGLAALLGYLLV